MERVNNGMIILFRELNPMFDGGLQHDAHEVLQCLMCYIQDAVKGVNTFRKIPKRIPPNIRLYEDVVAEKKMKMVERMETDNGVEKNEEIVTNGVAGNDRETIIEG